MKRTLLTCEMSTTDYLEDYAKQNGSDFCIQQLTWLFIEGISSDSDSRFAPLYAVRLRLIDPELTPITNQFILDYLAKLLEEKKASPKDKFNLQYSCAQILVWGHIYKPSTIKIASPLTNINYQHLNDFTVDQWKAFRAMILYCQTKTLHLEAADLNRFTHWTRLGTALTSTGLTSLILSGCRLYDLSIDNCKVFVAAIAQLPIEELDLAMNSLSSMTGLQWQALLNPELKKSRIRQINLCNNSLSNSSSWKELINFLAQFQLSILNIRYNGIYTLSPEIWNLFCQYIKNSCITTLLIELPSHSSSPARLKEDERIAELQTILNQNILRYSIFPGEASLKNTILFSMWHQPVIQEKIAGRVYVPAELAEKAEELRNQWGIKLGY